MCFRSLRQPCGSRHTALFSRNVCHEITLLRRIARTQAIEALASTLDQPNRSGAARSPRKWHGRNKGQSRELRHLNRLNRKPSDAKVLQQLAKPPTLAWQGMSLSGCAPACMLSRSGQHAPDAAALLRFQKLC